MAVEGQGESQHTAIASRVVKVRFAWDPLIVRLWSSHERSVPVLTPVG
jgi:hypothetical protein